MRTSALPSLIVFNVHDQVELTLVALKILQIVANVSEKFRPISGADPGEVNRTEQNRYVYLESYTKIVHRLFPNK